MENVMMETLTLSAVDDVSCSEVARNDEDEISNHDDDSIYEINVSTDDKDLPTSAAKLQQLNLKKKDLQNQLKILEREIVERLDRRKYLLRQEQIVNSEIGLHFNDEFSNSTKAMQRKGQKTMNYEDAERKSNNKGKNNREKQKRTNPSMDRRANNKRWRSSFKSTFKVVEHEDDTFDDTLVTLDTYHSDLNLTIAKTRYAGESLTNDGFSLMWAGAKATYGFKEGKICYEVKVVKHLNIFVGDDEVNPHVVRVGWSVSDASLQLGEDLHSYGYDGTAKSSTNCEFNDYGQEFKEGDVIACFLNIESDPVELLFAKNGEDLGVAFTVPKEDLNGKTLFPHILTKNCSFEVNFGENEESFFELPNGYEDYVFAGKVEIDKRVRATKGPVTRAECEMIMMCGLPRAGKTTWVSNCRADHRDKNYYILGTDAIIDKMTVMGLSRKRNNTDWWTTLFDTSTRCLNKMLEIASHRRRNFILDEANVFSSAHRRKMKVFEGFKRRAVVLVPTDEEYKRRVLKRKQEDGSEIPNNALLDMKASFALPEVGPIFDEVEYAELDEAEAKPVVKEYLKEGRTNKQLMSNDHRPSLMMTSLIGPPTELRGEQLGQDNQRFGKHMSKGSGGYGNRGGHFRSLMDSTKASGGFNSGPSGYGGVGMNFNRNNRGGGSSGGFAMGVDFSNYGGGYGWEEPAYGVGGWR